MIRERVLLLTKDRLVPGRVCIFKTPVSAAVPELTSLLNHTELKRYGSYRKEEDQKRALLSFALLRLLLSQVTGKSPGEIKISRACPYCGKPHGKPQVLDEGPIEVNISHSGKWVLIAIALHTPVGIDIEKRTPDRIEDEMVKRVLSTEEIKKWEKLSESEKEAAFYLYWTRKEAILKATGEGLTVPMTRLSVTHHDQSPRLIKWEGNEEKVSQIHCYPLLIDPKYEACLAVIGRCEEILLKQGEDIIQAWLTYRDVLSAR